MNLNIQLIQYSDFIRTTPTGELDLESTRGLMTALAESVDQNSTYPMLIDVRQTSSLLQKLDIFELASSLMQYGSTFRRRTAILTRDDDSYDRAAFFELVAHNRGYYVNAFSNFEEAIMWLAQEEASQIA